MIKHLILGIVVGILLVSCTANRTDTPTPTRGGEWQNLPLMPNAVEGGELSARAGYRYTIDVDIDTAMNFYLDAMDTAGWELLGKADTSGQDFEARALWYTKGGKTVTVDIWVKNNTTHVALVPEP